MKASDIKVISRHGQGRKILGKRFAVAVVVASLIAAGLAGCTPRRQVINSQDYVEIDNPLPSEGGDANAKIWVPKASLEKGVPRGREVAKIGYDKLAAAKVTDAATAPRSPLRLRYVELESPP